MPEHVESGTSSAVVQLTLKPFNTYCVIIELASILSSTFHVSMLLTLKLNPKKVKPGGITCVRTPKRVDFPTSALPNTQTRNSMHLRI